jgi:hypothetical protein
MRRSTITAAASICLALLLSTAASVGSTAASAAPAVSRLGPVLPADFRAQSQSWVSSKHGWILGVGPCGQTTCTTVLGTTDGGQTWNTVGTMDAPLTTETKTGVSEIRFADDLHGWAFAPSLWATSDGGVTWKKKSPPGGGRQVPALAGDADAIYALVSPCRLNEPPSHCKPTLWRRTIANGTWTQVSVTLRKGLGTYAAVLKVYGVVAYLVIPVQSMSDPDILDVTTDGQSWAPRPDPCVKADDEMLTDVAPNSATNVALLCVGDPGVGHALKRIVRSTDNAMTTTFAGSTDTLGIVSQIAASPNGTLAVSSWSAPGSWIYRNSGGKTWTTPVGLNDNGVGWNDITFTTNKVGFVVYGPAAVYPGTRVGEYWETIDGGLTWSPV